MPVMGCGSAPMSLLVPYSSSSSSPLPSDAVFCCSQGELTRRPLAVPSWLVVLVFVFCVLVVVRHRMPAAASAAACLPRLCSLSIESMQASRACCICMTRDRSVRLSSLSLLLISIIIAIVIIIITIIALPVIRASSTNDPFCFS